MTWEPRQANAGSSQGKSVPKCGGVNCESREENATGPCTHHIHGIIHFTENVPKPTFKRLLDRFILKFYTKDEGVVKHDYNPNMGIDVRS